MKKMPSILNDVIGPIMRGPSSSHTAASWRIARTCLDILNEELDEALIEFDENGAWAPNYREQGTCMGIDGGLLGLRITVSSFPTNHANTARLTLRGKSGRKMQVVAISTGGGAFKIQTVDGFNVRFQGDLFGLVFFASNKVSLLEKLKDIAPASYEFSVQEVEGRYCFQAKSPKSFPARLAEKIQQIETVDHVALINPVLPVLSGQESEMPFDTIQSLIDYAEETNSDLGDLGLLYEKCRSGFSVLELRELMDILRGMVDESINIGLKGTRYRDRILQQQSHLIGKAEQNGTIPKSIINTIVANVSALMESKSAMEVIVAIPTAGSCGTVGGSLRALADSLGSTNNERLKAYYAAGIVGAYFAMGPGFSAEEHGCQVECGAASGMAAAGLVQLMGGTAKQALGAATMAIQNMIGLVCDPVADRVEVPCLGKNISAAVNAYSSAIMAISGYDPVIPLDQVIETVSRVSSTMPTCVKCTGKGGLAITKTAFEIKKRLILK